MLSGISSDLGVMSWNSVACFDREAIDVFFSCSRVALSLSSLSLAKSVGGCRVLEGPLEASFGTVDRLSCASPG